MLNIHFIIVCVHALSVNFVNANYFRIKYPSTGLERQALARELPARQKQKLNIRLTIFSAALTVVGSYKCPHLKVMQTQAKKTN